MCPKLCARKPPGEVASDANALIPAIKDARDRGLAPKELLADSLYGSERNVDTAAAMGTEVVAPVPGGDGTTGSRRGIVPLSR
jgi:hypothetical protein